MRVDDATLLPPHGADAMGAPAFERGAQVMTVCNACRYCEQYCPVFPAMEQRVTFDKADLTYLANLCHNCGECLYACQYAPPHEFGIDVPRLLAGIRVRSYEEYCWPRPLGAAFRRSGVTSALLLAVLFVAAMFGATGLFNPGAIGRAAGANFYAIVPYAVMVTVFGAVFAFVLLALAIGVRRFWRDVGRRAERPAGAERRPSLRALRDALTLRHLHGAGDDCVNAEEARTPWRRWFHHCTFYGFMLCFASTSVAAVYHALGWAAPYPYTSLPVILGTVGGIGLLVGPAGLLAVRTRRDPDLGDRAHAGLDESFIVLLFLTSLTGLVLLLARGQPTMGLLLMVHLGVVLALFVTLPYGKFVHGLYRVAALVKYWREDAGRGH